MTQVVVNTPRSLPPDPLKLAISSDRVSERVACDEGIRQSVREVLAWLQSGIDDELLSNLRLHEEPVSARMQEMFNRGVSRGIELACEHVTEPARLREVRGWLESQETGVVDGH